jgi:hypothetical protein
MNLHLAFARPGAGFLVILLALGLVLLPAAAHAEEAGGAERMRREILQSTYPGEKLDEVKERFMAPFFPFAFRVKKPFTFPRGCSDLQPWKSRLSPASRYGSAGGR